MSVPDGSTLLKEGSRELAMAGLALTLAGLALTPICVALARRIVPHSQVFFARWRFLHAGCVAAVLVLASTLAPSVVGALDSGHALPEALRGLSASLLALGLTSIPILLFAARLDPQGIPSLGLRTSGALRACAAGLLSYALLVPGLFGVSLLWPWLLERLGGHFEVQDIAVALGQLAGNERWAGALLAVLVLPFFEELVFRGFLQPLLVQNLGDRGGVFLASLIFAVLHGDSAFLPILALALLLGSLMLRTQRLAACWLVHALHNGLALLLLGAT